MVGRKTTELLLRLQLPQAPRQTRPQQLRPMLRRTLRFLLGMWASSSAIRKDIAQAILLTELTPDLRTLELATCTTPVGLLMAKLFTLERPEGIRETPEETEIRVCALLA